ncbi:MAG: hypothetical protein A3A28_01875 [Candidatus Sungbacteria bacterium RIFCSPLOWO2_01_FULL_47_32]|nr:MAG: hypothetical protein A3D57_02155 [Candidatus Sungbacteria bacterium RIFCSPHIGHO2_02_FULL_46_12]OHA05361.1 MAG: hypothetical protein A3A28_01875 [Candidatus Sungbacteria bacterium RIFCSPLOWO2_01_FULL_47_32]
MMIPVPLGPGREYRTISALASGEVVILDGISLKMDEGEIESGDLYVAERNTGPKLLTARAITRDNSFCGGIVFPTTLDYAFDFCECVKVREV